MVLLELPRWCAVAQKTTTHSRPYKHFDLENAAVWYQINSNRYNFHALSSSNGFDIYIGIHSMRRLE